MIAGHAALLAWKAGRPVKMIYDRAEDMVGDDQAPPVAHATSHGASTETARSSPWTSTSSSTAAPTHALAGRALARHDSRRRALRSARTCASARRAVATNTPPHGAFRGFGAPQSVFALERHMDRVARRLRASTPRSSGAGTSSQPGGRPPTGQVRPRAGRHATAPRPRVRAVRLSREDAQRFAAREPREGGDPARHRLRHASCTARASPARARSTSRRSSASRPTPDGHGPRARGQHRDRPGHQHDLRADRRRCARARLRATSRSCSPTRPPFPNSGPTVASRTCMVVGKLVESAALGAEDDARPAPACCPRPYDRLTFRTACGRLRRADTARCAASAQYQPAGRRALGRRELPGRRLRRLRLGRVRRRGRRRHGDLRGARRRLRRGAGGRQGHPPGARRRADRGRRRAGRSAGRCYENVVWKDGRMVNGQMTNYIMPTSADLPPIRVFFVELPYADGPGGAKGIGELPMDGPAPAIVNAMRNATGLDVRGPRCRADARGADGRSSPVKAAREKSTRELSHGATRPSPSASTARRERRRPSDGAPARRAARGAAPDRHQGRLRRGRVRRVRGARRRRARQQLPGRRCSRSAGAAITTIEGVAVGEQLHAVQQAFLDARRRAVRHLHAGHDPRGGALCAIASRADRGRDPRRPRRQPLPLHRLHEDLRRRAPRAAPDAGRSSALRTAAPCDPFCRPTRCAAPPRSTRRSPARRGPGAWRPFAGGTDLMVLLAAGTLPHRPVHRRLRA